MWKSLNLKSLLIGALLAFVVMCALGSTPVVQEDKFERFTIYSHFDNLIILDKATGQIWTEYVPETFRLESIAPPSPPDEFFGSKL